VETRRECDSVVKEEATTVHYYNPILYYRSFHLILARYNTRPLGMLVAAGRFPDSDLEL
jgi:hypothetical protein